MNVKQIQPELFQRLLPVIQRSRLRRVFLAIAMVLLLGTLTGFGLAQLIRHGYVVNGWSVWGTFLLTFIALAIVAGGVAAWSIDPKSIGKLLETKYPELDAALLTAMEQDCQSTGMTFLQREVIRTAIYHSYQNRWPQAVPTWHWLGAPCVAMIALISLAASAVFVARTQPLPVPTNNVAFESTLIKTNNDFELVAVEPGSIEVEKGTTQLVLATFSGEAPASAELVTRRGDEEFRIPMKKSLDDPVFGGRIVGIDQDTEYWVEFGNEYSETYRLRVFEFPEMVSNQAVIHYPPYTNKESKSLTNVRRLSAVTGSTADLTLQLNQSVTTAQLVPAKGEALELKPSPEDPTKLNISLPFREVGAIKYELKLVNSDERKNKLKSKLIVNVQANKIPRIQFVQPTRDTQVSAVEELDLKARIFDDYGIHRVGLTYAIGEEETELELGKKLPKSTKEIAAALDMEALQVEPKQMISFYFWAEDLDADEKVRRIASDMFFAEVRPFDEIYRQAQNQGGNASQNRPSQQGNQGGQQSAQQLIQLQKDIVNAAWNTLRREQLNDQPSAQFEPDVNLIAESQAQAIALLEQAKQQATDTSLIDETQQVMQSAETFFVTAGEKGSQPDLKSGLNKARLALQNILGLRADENNVQRQRQQSSASASSSNSNSRQQQQLNSMELQEQENRYEDQRTEEQAEQESAEERENRVLLNRLSELARRQADLNQRMRELEAALLEAESEEEKEELEEELKRLREEQQRIAEDLDDVVERMEQSPNQQMMDDAREQAEQARENAQQTAESLRQNRLSQASASGRRTENNLDELKEEFQNRSSQQFQQQMQELRNRAQELELDEQKLAQQLQNENREQDPAPGLGEREETDELEKQLEDNAERFRQLKEEVKETIEKAEESQPVLAEELYDTFRESEQNQPDRALESAARSLRAGFEDDARDEETKAREGIRDFREGIERAAENVLGDDTQTLESIRQRVDRIRRQLENEVNRNDPAENQQGQNQQGQNQQGQNQQGQNQQGQNQQGQNQQGQNQQGQNQQGQNQQGQNQQGQNQQGQNQQGQNQQGQNQQGQNQQGQNQQGQNQQGQNQQGQNQQGQNQQGQNQQGQNQQGQNQQGQNQQGQNQQGQNQQGQNQQGQNQQGQNQQGQNQQGQNQQGQNQQGQAGGRNGQRDERRSLRGSDTLEQNRRQRSADGVLPNLGGDPNQNDRNSAPLTGDDYQDWVDQLRDIESMAPLPGIRANAANIREGARDIRKEYKRHSKDPNWPVVRERLLRPLNELQQQVTEELIRRSNKNATLPIEKQSVPKRYQSTVEKYFESLGGK